MQLIIIFQIVLKLILNSCFLTNVVHNIKYWNNFILLQSSLYTKNSQILHDICNHTDICVLNQYKSILLNQNPHKTSALYQKNNNKLGFQLENHTVNMLYLFYNRKIQLITNTQRILYFLQLGMQNIFTDKTINLGIGKRYIQNNLYGIGYNIIYNIPILNHYTNLPYSINIGGEYWYRNFIISLNGYYNLNKLLHFDKLVNVLDILEYPITGYQICIQTTLPYVMSNFRTQIKLEKFFHIQEPRRLFNNADNNFYSLSIGLGYKPNSILDISIDNVFVNNKYTDILFKLALNYQFNTLFSYQIQQKHYNNKLLNLDHAYSILKSFTPNANNIKINDSACNMLKTVCKITGYSKEVKYIKINNKHEPLLKWYTASLEQNGGTITHLIGDLYKINLPRYNSSGNNKIVLVYEKRDKNNTVTNKQKILIFIEQFKQDNVKTKTYPNPIIAIEDIHGCSGSNSQSLSTHNEFDQNKSVLSRSSSSNSCEENNITAPSIHFVSNNNIGTVQEKIVSDNEIIIHDTNCIIPVPPPIPKLFENIIQSNRTSSDTDVTLLCAQENNSVLVKPIGLTPNIIDQISSSVNLLQQTSASDKHTVAVSFNKEIDSNTDIKKFSYQLLMQKKIKFSSIGTEEYMNKLENSITERKKMQHTTEIGKMFSKLHKSFSYSSVEESLNTDDDNTDSFSESSKN